MNPILLDRQQWGAPAELPRRGHSIGPHHRTEVVLHHTTSIDGDSTPNEWSSMDDVARQMRRLQVSRPDLGLDVPYSMVAFCMADGGLVLAEGRGLHRTGAHSKGHNRSALGIAFQGDFENQPPPTRLATHIETLALWLRRLRVEKGFDRLGSTRPSDRDVWAHMDLKATACPGRALRDHLPRLRFVEDPTWSAPGDPVESLADANAVLAASDLHLPEGTPADARISVALVADRMMRLERRVSELESSA